MKGFFLGVDGGATRSSLILINSKGEKFFEAKGDSLSYRAVGEEKFIKNLENLVSKVKNKKINFSCFALAGVDNEKEKKKILKLIKESKIRKIIKSSYILINDVEAILPSENIKNGVAIIAGTGSNFYAKNKNLVVRAGGLDYILSDEGSAFYIGQKVLRAAVKSADGRGRKTILEKMVLKETKIKNVRDLTRHIYTEKLKVKVASFAYLTEEAIRRRDKVAKEIILSAARELELGALAVIKKVKLSGKFKICLVGSAFKNPFLLKELKRRLKRKFKDAKIIRVENPALGAAKLAKKEFSK